MTTPADILSFLGSKLKLTRSAPCVVTIGRSVYPAAHYFHTLTNEPGTLAYARGEREYSQEVIYCAGMLPSCFVRGNVAFRLHLPWSYERDSRDWYVACYSGAIVARKQTIRAPDEYHPHGNMFMLSPWFAGEAIDQYARVPYRRVAMVVE